MKRRTLIRRVFIGFLLVLTLFWVWREPLGLPVTIDGLLACLGLPTALALFIIPNDRSMTDGTKGVGLGYATLMIVFAIVMLISLASRLNQTTFRGTELSPLSGRMVFCFLSWAVLFLALTFIASLEGDERDKNSPSAT